MRISDWSSDVCSSDLFMPGPEPHYFSTEFHRGPDWYEDFFAAAAADQVVGEKSADYLAHPEAARRIAQRLPEARLVVQLRNPIDRAYSDYCMFFRSEEHTSELQSIMRTSYAVFCLKT